MGRAIKMMEVGSSMSYLDGVMLSLFRSNLKLFEKWVFWTTTTGRSVDNKMKCYAFLRNGLYLCFRRREPNGRSWVSSIFAGIVRSDIWHSSLSEDCLKARSVRSIDCHNHVFSSPFILYGLGQYLLRIIHSVIYGSIRQTLTSVDDLLSRPSLQFHRLLGGLSLLPSNLH